MTAVSSESFIFTVALLLSIAIVSSGYNVSDPFGWKSRDNFDVIQDLMDAVTADNCHRKSEAELRLPRDAIHQTPSFNSIIEHKWFQNRTQMMYMHSLALNRAHFYSHILQRLNNSYRDYEYLPGFMYYYFSTAADVSSGDGVINASAIFMDINCTFPNWLIDLDYNQSVPLFAPKAVRKSSDMIEVTDYGAGPNSNYTDPEYRTNPYVTETKWLPNNRLSPLYKHLYDVEIQYDDRPTNMAYYGPSSPGTKEYDFPVKFTSPYFDCGKSNKWIVTAVAPIVDFTKRYPYSRYMYAPRPGPRGPQIVGLVTIDIDYTRLDFNPCPASTDNENHFLAGTARCKYSTECEPLSGFGFRRGGYQCQCSPLYRLPSKQNGPFQGVDIERATGEEYDEGFECVRIQPRRRAYLKPLKESPLNRTRRTLHGNDTSSEEERPRYLSLWEVLKVSMKEVLDRVGRAYTSFRRDWLEPTSSSHRPRLVSRQRRSVENRSNGTNFDPVQYERVRTLLTHMERIDRENCVTMSPADLEFPGEVGYGADTRFEMQARIALRLAHFLSAFYQNNLTGHLYDNLKLDKPLNMYHLFGEVLANVIGDPDILASGIYFDDRTFVNEKNERWLRFAPYAYRHGRETHTFKALDMSIQDYRNYTEKPWFRILKENWATNTDGLQTFVNKFWKAKSVRTEAVEHFEHYPMYFRAARLNDGLWTQPYFDCHGKLTDWVLTFAVPFFGIHNNTALSFMGVVTVTVPLRKLDINQCPSSVDMANFFKNTAHCNYTTTSCIPWPRGGFTWGNYRCECLQGFHMPQGEYHRFFQGITMEREYAKKLEGKPNRLDLLRCLPSSAMVIKSNMLITLLALVVLLAPHGWGSGRFCW